MFGFFTFNPTETVFEEDTVGARENDIFAYVGKKEGFTASSKTSA